MSTIGLENQQVPGVRDAILAAEKAGEKAEGATKEAAKAADEAKRAADYAEEAIGTAQEAIQTAEEATEATNNATNTLNEKIDEINASLETVKEAADVAMGMEDKINAETAAREADRDALQTNINLEVMAREQDRDMLQANINTEVNARVAADKELKDQIDGLSTISGDMEQEINTLSNKVDQNKTDTDAAIAQTNDNVAANSSSIVEIKAAGVQKDTLVTGNDSTVTITKTVGTVGSDTTTNTEMPLPVASETQAGVINPATYKQIQDAAEKIEVLMGNTTVVPDLPENPTDDQLTEAYKEATGKTEVPAGAKITGPDGKTYVYNSETNTWDVFSEGGGSIEVSQFTNEAAGLIKGSTVDGKVFAESDGTGSVQGWDELKASAASHDTDIAALKTAMETENTRTQNLPAQVVYNTSTTGYTEDEAELHLIVKDLHTGGDATLPTKIAGATNTKAGVMTKAQVVQLDKATTDITALNTNVEEISGEVATLSTDSATKEELATANGKIETLESAARTTATDISNLNTSVQNLTTTVEGKQDELVSGTNIKTINGETLLGSGDITLGGGGGGGWKLIHTFENSDWMWEPSYAGNNFAMGKYSSGKIRVFQDEGSRLLWFVGYLQYSFKYNSSNNVIHVMAKLPSNIVSILSNASNFSGAMGTHVCSLADYSNNSNIPAVRATEAEIAQMSFTSSGSTYEWGISLGSNASLGTTKWGVIDMVNVVCTY